MYKLKLNHQAYNYIAKRDKYIDAIAILQATSIDWNE